MRTRIAFLTMLLAAPIFCDAAHADAETDRLREALRSATAQARQMEDQRTALQAKIADADREKAALKTQVNAAKAETKQLQKDHREAVDEFNQRLEERNQTLEKWKAAYEEAATVARTKDAERAKFEGEATAFKASTKSCLAKNAQLLTVGRDILKRYRSLTVGDSFVASEPAIGVGRVDAQNFVQESTDKLLDQKATP
jgi:chromosome segregation ATPase